MSVFSSDSPPLRELTSRQIQWIAAGYTMTLSSMPGQTIFIAQFNEALRGTFELSHGEFGFLYTLATLASSVCLIWTGAFADKVAPRTLALICMGGLVAIGMGMSQVGHVVLLGVALFGLRLFGQGMMGHIAMTTMSRWFNRFRGRALSFAQLGFPTGEALMPFCVTLAIAAIGWRQVWLVAAAIMALVLMPLVAFLLRDPPDGRRARARGEANPDGSAATSATGESWTRGAVLRDPLFYMIIPGFMAPSAIGTLFIFHQANLAEIKGWDLTVFTAFFPALSITIVLFAIVSGILIDRFGAWRIVPVLLIPLGVGCLVIGTLDPIWSGALFLALFGMTNGMMAPVMGALWAELYGTAHLGTIRALATAAMVLASAIGPGIAGGLIDMGIPLDTQAFAYMLYSFGAAIAYTLMRPLFAARTRAMAEETASVTPG